MAEVRDRTTGKIGDPVLIVSDAGESEMFHIVVQQDPEWDVAMCGKVVVVEDPDYLLQSDRDSLTTDGLCPDCCGVFAYAFGHATS